MDSILKGLIYQYLDYKNVKEDNYINNLIIECLDEIESISAFKYIYQEFDYRLDFLENEPYNSYLEGTEKYYISAMTLGSVVDKRIKYYSINNLTKMVVFDACASAYLEYKANEFEKEIDNNLSYRFCPGYEGSSILDLKNIFPILKPERIGITLLPSNLMVPQKSMVGIIAKTKRKKSCNDCLLFSDCVYQKEGRKCRT